MTMTTRRILGRHGPEAEDGTLPSACRGGTSFVSISDSDDFYRQMVQALTDAGAPFLVGGAYAFARYTGIERHTKDFDIFVRPSDVDAVLGVLAGAGCSTELTYPHWLAKAYRGEDFVDVIFSSGNGVAVVDDEWFAHAVEAEVLGRSVLLCPAEETLWSKAFVMERERFDGADVAHLLLWTSAQLDWHRLLRRFGQNWPVLMAHITLFGFSFPSEADRVPDWVTRELLGRAACGLWKPVNGERVCRGTILSREQYLIDVQEWGYRDGRLPPDGRMTEAEIAEWTDAIDDH
ncbi:MAG: hypothetical protein QOF73_2724 [Thermomicrobiales bacterium]|jgi:hypothetical protein|nr:hypothetical protein [Thermomicrobiales bacterium]